MGGQPRWQGQACRSSATNSGLPSAGRLRRIKPFSFWLTKGCGRGCRRASPKLPVVPDLNARQGMLPDGPVEVDPRIVPYLDLFPEPTPGGRVFASNGTAETIFVANEPTTENFVQGRFDHQFSDSDSFFVRFTASNAERNQVRAYPSLRTIRFMGTRLLTLSETHIVSPRMLNTFRASFNRVDPIDRGIYPDVPDALLSVPGTVVPAFRPGSGITNFSGNTKPFDRWTSNRYNFKNDISYSTGSHSLQFGGMLERLQFNMDQPNRPYGEWQFRDLKSFLTVSGRNPIRRLRGTPPQIGSSVRGWRQWYFALYLQDDWQVTPRLTLNLGVRWEPYTPPGRGKRPHRQSAPPFGPGTHRRGAFMEEQILE